MAKEYVAKNVTLEYHYSEDGDLQCGKCDWKEASGWCRIIKQDVSFESYKCEQHEDCPFLIKE